MKAVDFPRTVTAVVLSLRALPRRLGIAALLFFCVCAHAKVYTIGFAQSDTAESDWRKANTASFREAAKEFGVDLLLSDAGGHTDVQRRQVQAFIQQKVDAIVLSANEVHGWDDILLAAKRARIPVILSDRTVVLRPENQDKGLFVTWIGSDFRYEGRAAAAWLAQATAGHCNIVEIQGPADAGPSIERAKGFREVLALFPGMRIIASRSGMWRAGQAKVVTQAFLKEEGSNICAVFAHNDNMAFGAIDAIQADRTLGLKPGKDVLIVSVDGVRHAFELLVQGKLNAAVECNPLLGRIVLKVALEALHGRSFSPTLYMEDKVYTPYNAAAALPARKY